MQIKLILLLLGLGVLLDMSVRPPVTILLIVSLVTNFCFSRLDVRTCPTVISLICERVILGLRAIRVPFCLTYYVLSDEKKEQKLDVAGHTDLASRLRSIAEAWTNKSPL